MNFYYQHIVEFIHKNHQFDEILLSQIKQCILDLIAVAVGGRQTLAARIISDYAAETMQSKTYAARMLFDGRVVSLPAAAMVGAMTIDAMDAHDGHVLTKGHVGVTVLPVALALADAGLIKNGEEFIQQIYLGYEFATRAGISLHNTTNQYHTSGAWNALAAAAMCARAIKLNCQQTWEALGIAEFFAPRSQMMRCIDYPTMVKDGSSWGAMAGVSAAFLAQKNFTGAPAISIANYEVADLWQDLSIRHRILEQYFKLYPVCRWAQPAIEAINTLIAKYPKETNDLENISSIKIQTFFHATKLATRYPTTTEMAQYSLSYPVAVMLCHREISVNSVLESAFADKKVKKIASKIIVEEDIKLSKKFPAERWAKVSIKFTNENTIFSGAHTAQGDAKKPLDKSILLQKFNKYTECIWGSKQQQQLIDIVYNLENLENINKLLDYLLNYTKFPSRN